jgi:hypothetical protein
VLYSPSPARMFIYSSHGKCPFPPLQWCFSHTDTFTSFPAPRLLGGYHHSCLFRPVCLQFHEGLPLPPFSTQGALPSLLCVLLLLFIIQFFFFSLFSLGGSQSVQGAMVIWPRVVCGSTACRLANLVVCISRASGSWRLVVQEPSWFLRLPWSGDTMCGLVVWRSSSISPKFYFRNHTF